MTLLNDENKNAVSKECENECPNCGAFEGNIMWGHFVFDEVVSLPGKCLICGQEFKEFFMYSDTEYYPD